MANKETYLKRQISEKKNYIYRNKIRIKEYQEYINVRDLENERLEAEVKALTELLETETSGDEHERLEESVL